MSSGGNASGGTLPMTAGLDDVLDAWAVPTRPPPSVIGHDDDRRGPTTASGRSTIRAGSPRAPTRPSVAAP